MSCDSAVGFYLLVTLDSVSLHHSCLHFVHSALCPFVLSKSGARRMKCAHKDSKV